MNEVLLLSNPGKRKHKRKHKRKNKARRVSYRRNPSVRSITGQVMPTVKNGFFGALGGLGNDLLYGFGKGYLPVMLQAGYGRTATKLLSAVLVGIAGNYVMRGKGTAFATGAATVVLHEAMKEQLAVFAPSLPLGALDEPPGLLAGSGDPVGEYMDDGAGMGEYMEEGAGMGGDDSMPM
jgi:hypothetical protein